MTFKHTSFDDSATMRALTKIALEKGLIKAELPVFKKEASAPNYTPTANFLENFVKLCSGLQLLGLGQYSQELETYFINYKKAEASLYDTSGEKGEDLVDQAHPDGSHKMENVEGDATIETIVDQHLKDLQVVNKSPNGKLATNREIIKAVKLVLAQENEQASFLSQIKYNNNRILQEFNKVFDFVSSEVNLKNNFLPQLEEKLNNPTVENLQSAKNWIIYANNTIKQYVSDKMWKAIVTSNIFSKMVSFIQPSIELREKYDTIDVGAQANKLVPGSVKNEIKVEPQNTSTVNNVSSNFQNKAKNTELKIGSIINKLDNLVSDKKISKQEMSDHQDWLNTKKIILERMSANTTPNTDDEITLNRIVQSLDEFSKAADKAYVK